ncbi:hypothetical protein JTB14_019565 [Gonioctena quinquepunctata]|nr:hypothetical protein JTB14_019565 [Gonioctena quinquepunctata]
MDVLKEHLEIEEVEDCVVCLLKPCLESTHWLIPYEGYCVHSSRNYLGKPHFGKTKCGWSIYGLAAVMTSQLIWTIYSFFDTCAEDITSCLLLITAEIISLTTVVLYLTILFKSSYYLAATNMLTEISAEIFKRGRVKLISSSFRRYFYVRYSIGNITLYIV